jgi:hypothetical protein
MEKYITQLLADLEKAKDHLPPDYDVQIMNPDDPALEYGLIGVAEYLNSPYYPLENILGIKAEWFPPANKLNVPQIKALVTKLTALWSAFNYHADFPKKLPVDIRYRLMVEKLKEETQYVSDGFIGFEFCHYEPEECPFGKEYCSCKDTE